mgnify:FL=1
MISDIEIARNCKKENIKIIGKKLGIEDNLILYGNDKAKIEYNKIKKDRSGKLILVTSINPTPYGEGKTTVSIGLVDGLNKIDKNSIAVLREPSLGPVFGVKGGACGGGYSQVVPMEDINLHFTGDIHAIESANNLICAAIDNHIYFGNELDFKEISFYRCMDMNDRALRKVHVLNRDDKFNITSACEIMSVLCLSKDFDDLYNKLSNIIVGYNSKEKPIRCSDLKLTGSLTVLLKDAIKPNLVQTLENNPVIIHGGPFANIAHGCNSIIATDLGLKLSPYVVTEAGFGSDLGAEKFLDIKCRYGNFKPDCIVLVCTIKALKYNAGIGKEDILKENVEALSKGICNLEVHIENMLKYTSNIVVCLNKYDTDTIEEINIIEKFVKSKNVEFAISSAYSNGGNGAIELAEKVVNICDKENDFKMLYDTNLSIYDKIETICREIYHASNINYSDKAIEKINNIENIGMDKLPVCIAKTQYSISDNKDLLGYPKNYSVTVRDITLYAGAGFITVYLGDIMTMPGLSKHANYERIDIDSDGNIVGLS